MTQRIRVLDDALINRIAAGEVVERPASAVKELVENAIDAGSRRIRVQLESGGKRSIVVEDDGSGMSRDDAILSLERHATSKLRRLDDLDSIATMGFRGEALSSIASVSTFVLTTAEEDGRGTEIRVRGGRIDRVSDVGAPRGTTVRVERLFHNVPARRKFLRAESTELGHVARWVTRYALAHPEIGFSLTHGTRRLVDAPPAPDRAGRIAQLYGADLLERLAPFTWDEPGLRIEGLAGRPSDSLPRNEAQHFFVNSRAVQDRVLIHAVRDAYGNAAPPGRHPALFAFLTVEPGRVDVNVHPQKTEVRFRDGSRVHDALRDAVQAALGHEHVVPTLGELRRDPTPRLVEVREATLGYLERHSEGAGGGTAGYRSAASSSPSGNAPTAPVVPEEPAGEPGAPQPVAAEPETRPLPLPDVTPTRLTPLAQYRRSFIIAEDDHGLAIVDQHAAHERILFERFLHAAEENRVELQRLLFPATFELGPAELATFEREQEELRRLGFHADPFGGRTVRLEAVPAVTAALDPEQTFRELLGEAARARSAVAHLPALRRRLVTTAACKAAVKFNDDLNRESMQALLDDLQACRSPSTCPHGRALIFRLTDRELERLFDRG